MYWVLCQNRYMKKLYVSKKSNIILQNYLSGLGYSLELTSSSGIVDEGISCHPDIFLCKMGIDENAPIFFAQKEDLGCDYPQDVAFNAACTGKYFIHNLSATNEKLIQAAENMNMTLINVRQGYTKCSTVVVDENSIITYDDGIRKSCSKYPELSVLKIVPGFVELDGYDTGFIGGCSGRVGDCIIFNGNLEEHPDFLRIVDFIEKRGLQCKWFTEYKLTDIGSIL